MRSIKDKILQSIESLEAGYAISARDFLHDFKRYKVDNMALSWLVKKSLILRVIPGIYEHRRD